MPCKVAADLRQLARQRRDHLLRVRSDVRGFRGLVNIELAGLGHHALHVLRHIDAVGVLAHRQPHGFEFLKALQPIADRAVVRECAAQPALGDVRHAATACFALNDFLGLALGADEQDESAAADDLRNIAMPAEQAADGFAQVDDVDQVSLAVDVRPHLRVPPAGPVTVMHASVEQVLDLNNGHAVLLGYTSLTETFMFDPPRKREVCPPNLAGKVRGYLYGGEPERQCQPDSRPVHQSHLPMQHRGGKANRLAILAHSHRTLESGIAG